MRTGSCRFYRAADDMGCLSDSLYPAHMRMLGSTESDLHNLKDIAHQAWRHCMTSLQPALAKMHELGSVTDQGNALKDQGF